MSKTKKPTTRTNSVGTKSTTANKSGQVRSQNSVRKVRKSLRGEVITEKTTINIRY